jgi:CBS domain-containing protein
MLWDMETIAKDIMSTKLITIKATTLVEEAIKVLVNSKVTGLPVVDDEGKMIGILSEYDIIAAVAEGGTADGKVFQSKIPFTGNVITASDSDPLQKVLQLFIEKKCRRLPVIDSNKRLVGIISRRDVMRILFYRSKVGVK